MTTIRPELSSEYSNWKDSGCELFASCLACPRPRCIEDEPGARRRIKLDSRSEQMAELRKNGMSLDAIAALFQVSKRTVQRALSPRTASGGVRHD